MSSVKQTGHAHQYYPYIDGLRCLAVLPVILFHLAPALCPAGFLGVDIFFVISGYLICGGIVRDLKAGTFSMADFYFRRIRRILPAYIALVLAVLLAGLAFYHWGRLVPLAQTSLSSTFFAANAYFWLDTGYFQPNALGNPLLHLWSLGVEEQFYIVIPIAFLLVWKCCRAWLVPILVACFVVSVSLCILLGMKGQSTTAFYILPTRAWELFAGALLAIRPNAGRAAHASWLAYAGIAMILSSFWFLTTEGVQNARGSNLAIVIPYIGSLGITPFPGWINIPVIVGTVLLLRFGDFGLMGRVLRFPPIKGIGKISYSLYLWHWPVIVFEEYIRYGQPRTFLVSAVILGITFIAAFLSWRWVETPIRTSKRITPRLLFSSTAFAIIFLAGTSILLITTEGLRNVWHREANVHANPPRSFMPNFEKFTTRRPFMPPAYPDIDAEYVQLLGIRNKPLRFCLIGDSHAHDMAHGLDHAAALYGQSGAYLDVSMNPYVDDPGAWPFIEWIAKHPDIRTVYLVGRWLTEYNVSEGLPSLGEKGRTKPVILDDVLSARIEANFRSTAECFSKHGKQTVVFTCVPEYRYCPTDIMARSRIIHCPFPIEITRQDYLNRQHPISVILAKLESEGLISVIPLQTAFLPGGVTLFMDENGIPYYRDPNHLTPLGSRRAAEAIAPLLWKTNRD